MRYVGSDRPTSIAPTQILGTSGHVVLYDFNKQTNNWVHYLIACTNHTLDMHIEQVSKNIEGSLFVVKRRAMPRFQLFLLNKKGNGRGTLVAC